MDVRFLKNISEAYILDSDLKIESDQIFEELYDIVKFLQAYDLPLYNELYETTKLQQQKIFKNYLDITYENEIIVEEPLISLSASTILLGIAIAIFGKAAVKGVAKVFSTLGEGFETLGKWLARQGKYQQIRYAIVQENTRKCYAKCGIQKPSDISMFTYTSIKNKSSVRTATSTDQGRCLRECYISELIDVIALHMENYFACLKKTGKFEVVQKTDSDDIMKMVASTNVSAACESYYNAAREALDNFYRVLEMVYDSHSEGDNRLEKINALRTKIYEARQIVQKVNQNEIQRYNQPSFKPAFKPPQQNPNPNFRRN